MWPENTSFSPTLPKLQLAFDSVSSGTLKECPRKYELAIILGWRTKRENIHLEFGIVMHSAREQYYAQRAEGVAHEEALEFALAWLMNATWDHELNRPRVVFCEDSYKNRFTAARTLIWYLDQWRDDPLETIILANGKPAVEISFRYPIGVQAGTGEDFLLCGHIDRLVTFGGQRWSSDLKTTKHGLDAHFFAQFTPDNQFSGYSYAGKIILAEPTAGIIVDGVQVAVGFSRFARGLVHRTKAQLDEWMRGLVVLLRQAEQYAREDFWPMNEKSCFGCSFRGICSHSPQVREQWLKADFVKHIWDPLTVRGDV